MDSAAKILLVRTLPSGTVTFLFSDVEGSTKLLEQYGKAAGTALARHHELFEEIVDRHSGVIFETVGDAVYAAFDAAGAAIGAALDAHRALAREDWTTVGGRFACRIAIHTGPVEQRGDHYFGPALFRCARLQALGYGGQTLISGVSAQLGRLDLPEGARLRGLGTHRLKDLQEPETVFQLEHPDLRTDFPSVKSLDAHPHNLPVQLSTFVGREAEMENIAASVGQHRLVTLTGPGGTGKTRLALQVAAELVDGFSGGVWLIEAASLSDAGTLLPAVGAVLGVPEVPGQALVDTLVEANQDRDLLLVLDNLEQLLPGAAREVGMLMSRLPRLRVLATSRSPLHVRGEREVPVPPLDAGADDTLDEQLPAAVALFIDRARDAGVELAIDDRTGPLISTICRRLDGLPLAIELAASRMRLYALETLLERLSRRLAALVGGGDAPERQRTLRAAIAWSEELLTPSQRALLARLGAFASGFGLDAVHALSGGDNREQVEVDLQALVEHALVRRLEGTEDRFAMLETIREYAHERLEASGQADAVLDGVADFFINLTERLDEQLIGADQSGALNALDIEIANIRAVLARLRDRGDAHRLAALATHLARYLAMRGQARDGHSWISAAMEHARALPATAIARLRAADGRVLSDADPRAALACLEQAAATFREEGLDRELGSALTGMTNALIMLGQLGEAEAAAVESRGIARATGALRMEASAVGNLAVVALRRGDQDKAEAGFHEAVKLFRRAGDEFAVVIGLGNLGELAVGAGTLRRRCNCIERHSTRPGPTGTRDSRAGHSAISLGAWRHLARGRRPSRCSPTACGSSTRSTTSWRSSACSTLWAWSLAPVVTPLPRRPPGVTPNGCRSTSGWRSTATPRDRR